MKYPLHEYNGQMLTIRELAALAGCSKDTLHARVRHYGYSVSEAVAMGAANPSRRLGTVIEGLARRFEYRGQMLTYKELAKLAGCRWEAMRIRMKSGDAERAVNMGKASQKRKADSNGKPIRKAKKLKVKKLIALKASKPAKPPTRKTEAINPRNVKPTVLPGFSGTRYTFTPAPGWVGEISRMREQERSAA